METASDLGTNEKIETRGSSPNVGPKDSEDAKNVRMKEARSERKWRKRCGGRRRRRRSDHAYRCIIAFTLEMWLDDWKCKKKEVERRKKSEMQIDARTRIDFVIATLNYCTNDDGALFNVSKDVPRLIQPASHPNHCTFQDSEPVAARYRR